MDMLTLCVQPDESGGARVTARGDVDLSTVDQFRQAVLPAALEGGVVADMTGVEFLDSSGMLVLVDAAKITGRDGFVVLCRERGQPERVLRHARFDGMMQIKIVPAGSEETLL